MVMTGAGLADALLMILLNVMALTVGFHAIVTEIL